MNIGIMSFHTALNSGAVLQAYALQTQLERMGHQVEFINFKRKRKRKINHFIGKNIQKTYWKWEDLISAFWHKNKGDFNYVLNIGSDVYYSIEELQKNPPAYEVYITGSDQVWNVGSNKILSKQYYLSFGDATIKRIAFAASFGQCDVLPFLEEEIRNEVLKLDAVSVREKNGVDFLQNLMKEEKEVHHINDPTFLLSKEDYLKIADKTILKKKKKHIASYILTTYTQDQLNIIDYIKKTKQKKIINLRNPDTCIRLSKAKNKIVNPYQWLSYMMNAELIICNSFHAVVFSLIFKKEFIVITPYE